MKQMTEQEKLKRRVRANLIGGAGVGLFTLMVGALIFALVFTVLTFKAWLAFHSPVAFAYFIVCLLILGITFRATLRSYRLVVMAGDKAARHTQAAAQRKQEESGVAQTRSQE